MLPVFLPILNRNAADSRGPGAHDFEVEAIPRLWQSDSILDLASVRLVHSRLLATRVCCLRATGNVGWMRECACVSATKFQPRVRVPAREEVSQGPQYPDQRDAHCYRYARMYRKHRGLEVDEVLVESSVQHPWSRAQKVGKICLVSDGF